MQPLTKKIPTTYFELIQKVGSKGRYQRIIFILSFILWLITSLLVMGTSFLFLNPKVDCSSVGIAQEKCEDYVCSLPQNQRTKFYEKLTVVSLATEFGPFHCEKIFELSALRMTVYIGVFFGYLFVFYFTDNFGRKYSMVMAWGIAVFGIAILSASFNIWMAVVGLFFAGLGSQTCIRISMTLIGQIMENSLRQKYSIALQIAFGVGSIIIGIAYLLIGNWRQITIIFCLVPSIVLLLYIIFYIQETPKFLIDKKILKAIKSLNRIAKINKENGIVTIQDVENVSKNGVKSTKTRTPLDLCRFKSIRSNFIFVSIFLFCISFLYMGPSVIISHLDLNIFTSQIILGATEAIAYPFCFMFIENLPRKKSGYVLVGAPLIIFTILVFVEPPANCSGCFEGILQIVLVFAARFGICAYFSVFFLYITELFPLPLRGIGFGISSLSAALGNICSQFVLSSLSQTSLNPMILFAVISAVGCVAIFFLPETLNKKLEEQIEQEKQKSLGDHTSFTVQNQIEKIKQTEKTF